MIGKMKTPQTDDLARGNHVVPTEWAEQLERERDEAREERDKLQVMRKEVVAANKGAKINAQVSNSLAGKLNRAERERDEAREIAQQLINIASHCLGWHENANPETITEAIKRWNASTKK
jgi:hypothetical protein